MNIKNINKNNRKYILLCFSLLLIFWLITLFEVSATLLTGKEIQNFIQFLAFKFLNHFLAILIISLLLWPIYHLLAKKRIKTADLFIKIVFIILILLELMLTKYSLTTLLNLGADLLGYSYDDIYITVTASENMSLLFFIPFVAFPLLFLVSNFFLKKTTFFNHLGRIFIVVTFAIIIIRFAFSGVAEPNYQNKLAYFIGDVAKFQIEKSEVSSMKMEGKAEFPFLKPTSETKDVLGPFFNIGTEKPNIVIIMMEGLGSEFVGDKYYGGFTPFLDSLIPKSLYWDNFLSNSGRTFGALPSITASLPLGEKGFLEIKDAPTHLSLFSILKNNGYATSFFSGDQSSFDKKINFLEYNGVENIIDENKYDETYPKSVNSSNGFSWGYSDYEIYKKTLGILDDIQTPRLDMIFTLTLHEPFTFPVKDKFLVKVDSILNTNNNLKVTNSEVTSNKDIFASILYADASLKMFMDAYKKRPEFNNTIFIITGDHRLIPIEQKDKLCRFNVPFFIYSPMLKEGINLKSISSHLDVTPSVLAFLENNYDVELPKKSAWLGQGIDTSRVFRNINRIPLMRYKGSINDYVYDDVLYSDGKLFRIKENFSIHEFSDNKLLSEITKSFREFKNLNAYVTQNNKIFPEDTGGFGITKYKFTPEELVKIDSIVTGLDLDQRFMAAREIAFDGDRETARLVCNYLLQDAPNYVDVRILKGRTLAWDGRYDEAEVEFLDALKRSPYYDDIYLALLDMYWWSSQNDKAELIANKVKKNNIKSDDVAYKIARAYDTMKNKEKAEKIIDSLLKRQPKNKVFIEFKNSL